jgi:hypothetical protein
MTLSRDLRRLVGTAAALADAVAKTSCERGESMLIAATLHLPKGYIGHPYWPEREKLINIQKGSGTNRARNPKSRDAALQAYLDANNLTMDDYRLLEARAARPFYTGVDVGLGGDAATEIVIPAHHMHGMLAQAADQAPSAMRIARAEQIRSVVTASDFRTGKTKADGVWERFAVVKSGTGQALSNQRGLRSDPYIADVHAVGTFRLSDEALGKKFRQFVEWAGREIGVGAARKLAWGRFEVETWAVES